MSSSKSKQPREDFELVNLKLINDRLVNIVLKNIQKNRTKSIENAWEQALLSETLPENQALIDKAKKKLKAEFEQYPDLAYGNTNKLEFDVDTFVIDMLAVGQLIFEDYHPIILFIIRKYETLLDNIDKYRTKGYIELEDTFEYLLDKNYIGGKYYFCEVDTSEIKDTKLTEQLLQIGFNKIIDIGIQRFIIPLLKDYQGFGEEYDDVEIKWLNIVNNGHEDRRYIMLAHPKGLLFLNTILNGELIEIETDEDAILLGDTLYFIKSNIDNKNLKWKNKTIKENFEDYYLEASIEAESLVTWKSRNLYDFWFYEVRKKLLESGIFDDSIEAFRKSLETKYRGESSTKRSEKDPIID
jgi:hypothetical protein